MCRRRPARASPCRAERPAAARHPAASGPLFKPAAGRPCTGDAACAFSGRTHTDQRRGRSKVNGGQVPGPAFDALLGARQRLHTPMAPAQGAESVAGRSASVRTVREQLGVVLAQHGASSGVDEVRRGRRGGRPGARRRPDAALASHRLHAGENVHRHGERSHRCGGQQRDPTFAVESGEIFGS